MRYLVFAALSVLLASCSTSPTQPPAAIKSDRYLEEVTFLELQAIDSLQLGNYIQARRLYLRAYQAYAGIDDQQAMARQLLNRAQVSLILDDADEAEKDINTLHRQQQFQPQAMLESRIYLLRANLAVLKNDYQSAMSLTDSIFSSANAVEESTRQAALVTNAIAQHRSGKQLPPVELLDRLSNPLSKARFLRLLSRSLPEERHDQALSYISQSKQIYQSKGFAPGVAACLHQESRIREQMSQTEYAQELKDRARAIYVRVGNQVQARGLSISTPKN